MRSSRKSSRAPWIITGVATALVVVLLVVGRRDAVPQHPEPRSDAGSLAGTIAPAALFRGHDRAVRGYTIAQQMPEVLDGLYCHCQCRENFDHRSLLTCFQSNHGAACDICMGEVELAYRMVLEGRSLEEIREPVDLAYGR